MESSALTNRPQLFKKIGQKKILESNTEKKLGILINKNLISDVFDSCKKAGRKLSVSKII